MADTERKRLPGQQPRGLVAPTGCAAAFFVAFGLPFMAAGVALALLARGVIPWGRGGPMPEWLAVSMAALFGGAGLLLATRGMRALVDRSRLRARRERYPDEPWRVDYPWDPAGASHNPGASLPGQLVVMVFMALLLVPFNYLSFYAPAGGDMPFWARAIVVLFDVILVVVVLGMVLTVVQQARYGSARLAFQSFPFFLGDTLTARLATSRAIGEFKTLKITLRCIQELTVTKRHGTRHSIETVCDQLWADEVVHQAGALREGNEVVVRFDLPEGDYGTHLAAPPGRYWTLAVVADTPGLDFAATFLVPVYPRQ